MTLSKETLEGYYKSNFTLMQHFNYSLSDLEGMMPWEREIYLKLLESHIQEINEKQKRK
tara:strand:+ start:3076 stop:3252 length:177 start_codon:yes stop_codon:yes gene_type:complete